MNFFFRVFGVLSGQEPAHQLANDDGGGLENLPVGGDLAGYSKMGAELILDGTAHLVAGNLIGHCFSFLHAWLLRRRAAVRQP